jgi:hypothetical protein
MGLVSLEMKPGSFRKAHRWLGLFFSLSILTSSGSGILHNVMTYTQPPPPPARPLGGGVAAERIRIPVTEAIAKLPASDAQAINIRSIHGEPWYQIFTSSADRPAYISAMDGRVDPLQDERYAAQIASSFLGGAKVRKENYLTAFDNEYINIFRVLPVYRFDIDDAKNSRVYVSTMTGSVTRHTDDIRQFEANIFTNFHKLGFIANKIARDVILTFLTLGAFTVACLGIALFFLTSPARSERAASERRVSKPLNK